MILMIDQNYFDDDQNDDHDKIWVDEYDINLLSDLSKVETLEARLHSEPQLKRLFSIFCQVGSAKSDLVPDIDENSRSRKISWELATRILARSREILFYFSSPSRNSRFDRANSRSRLEARDIEDTNLDLVSNNEIIKISISSRKKRDYNSHVFAEIFVQ